MFSDSVYSSSGKNQNNLVGTEIRIFFEIINKLILTVRGEFFWADVPVF